MKLYRNTRTNEITEANSADAVELGEFGPLIQWHGGDCPVPHDAILIAYFRGRPPYFGNAIWSGLPERAKQFVWHHAPSGPRNRSAADIVGYRMLEVKS